jgi:hypothetical protein
MFKAIVRNGFLQRIIFASILLAVGNAVMATEEPAYTVVKAYDTFEVREYAPYAVAQTTVAGDADEAANQGFRILAGYIFGKNKGERKIEMTAPVTQAVSEPVKIAMTAPVTQSPASSGWLIEFAMPKGMTVANLPEPIDPRITLRDLPARTFAVIRYSGLWSQSSYESHLAILLDGLKAQGIAYRGEPIWSRYDAPWTLWFLRRNEIWLALD